MADTDEETSMPELDKYTPETFDGYRTASVMLPRGREVLKAQVVARKRDNWKSELKPYFGYEGIHCRIQG